jgi:peptidoglycan/xylan/chitin deacetylase (PgdA/CDA1 family)
MMMRGVWTALGLASLACSAAPEHRVVSESAGGQADSAASPSATAVSTARYDSLGDRKGRVPILEYHVIGDSATNMFVITKDLFRRNLQVLYDRGYRPITVAQLLDKDFSDVPPGMSPVVFTFDDASPEQFSYVEKNGQLEIDPESAVGIWMEFAKQHPDWKGRATFCLLPAAEAGHAFFGDREKWRGQKNEWRFRKVKWLADSGFELCNHTLWHAQLSKYPDAFVQEQIARGHLAIDSVVPGYKVRTFALPQGLWPKNRALAWKGSWTDPRGGKTFGYDYETVLEVSGGPNRSPYDPQFDSRKLSRVIVFGNALEQMLDRLDAAKSRFVWDGQAMADRR